MGHEKGKTARQIVESLIAEEGWKGFYRGLGPRFFSMSAWGTSMILAYEYLSMDFSLYFLHCIIFMFLTCYNNYSLMLMGLDTYEHASTTHIISN